MPVRKRRVYYPFPTPVLPGSGSGSMACHPLSPLPSSPRIYNVLLSPRYQIIAPIVKEAQGKTAIRA